MPLWWNRQESNEEVDSFENDRATIGETATNTNNAFSGSIDTTVPVYELDSNEQATAVHLSSFDWVLGRFKRSKVWIILTVQLVCSFAIVLSAVLLLQKGSNQSIIVNSPATESTLSREIFKLMLLVGPSFFVYSMIQLFLCLVPVIVFKINSARGLYVKAKTIQNIEGLLKLRRFIGLAAAGCFLSPMAFLLYRNQKSTERITVDDAALATMNVVKALNVRFEHYFNKPMEYFIGRGCLFLTVMWFMLLIEKIIVLLVSTQYHRRSLSIRIRRNELGRKITAGLRKHFIKSGVAHNKRAPSGELIFDAIGKETVCLQDFTHYMDEDEAGDYIDVLDPDNLFSGQFDRERYIGAIENLEREHVGIRQTLRGQLRVLEKFDTLLLCIVSFVLLFVLIAIMEPPVDFLVSFLVSLIAGLAFIFGPTAKESFDSIVFVLFTHSFDVGDWLVLADGIMYQPVDIGLMSTSFLTPQNDLTYFTNNSLNGMAIVNLKRSPMMSEPIKIPIMPDTPEEKLSQLEIKINEWLETQPSLFLPKISLREFNITDDGHMIVEVRLFHRYNFDDMTKKDHRTRLFVLKLRDILKTLGIKISQPVLPPSVKVFQ